MLKKLYKQSITVHNRHKQYNPTQSINRENSTGPLLKYILDGPIGINSAN